MADVNVHESGTYPAEHLVEDYFNVFPTDARYTSTEYRQFVAHTAMDKNSEKIEFVLETLNAPFCYQLSDALISATIHITKNDGVSMPEATAKVGPVNNVLGSLFERVTMRINDEEISTNSEFYPHRCYVRKLLSFDAAVKATQLWPTGWIDDHAGLSENIEPHANNQGWKARGNWFRKNYRSGAEFRPGVNFINILCAFFIQGFSALRNFPIKELLSYWSSMPYVCMGGANNVDEIDHRRCNLYWTLHP